MKENLIILVMRFAMLACNTYMGLFAAVVIVNAIFGRAHVATEALVAVGVCVIVRGVVGAIGGATREIWRFNVVWAIVGVAARPYAELLAQSSASGQYLAVSLLVIVGAGLTIYGATDIGSARDSSDVTDK